MLLNEKKYFVGVLAVIVDGSKYINAMTCEVVVDLESLQQPGHEMMLISMELGANFVRVSNPSWKHPENEQVLLLRKEALHWSVLLKLLQVMSSPDYDERYKHITRGFADAWLEGKYFYIFVSEKKYVGEWLGRNGWRVKAMESALTDTKINIRHLKNLSSSIKKPFLNQASQVLDEEKSGF